MDALTDALTRLGGIREETFAALSGLSEAQLNQLIVWRGGKIDLRFLLMQLADVDDERRVRFEQSLTAEGWARSETRAILAELALSRGQALAALAGLPEEQLDAVPAPGEWSVREVLGHIINTEQRYTVHCQYAAERGTRIARGEEPGPLRVAGARLPPLASSLPPAEPLAAVRQSLLEARAETLRALAGTDDALLTAESDWLGIAIDLRFRLHRFASHERQHLVQLRKTLASLGFQQSEAQLLLGQAELVRELLVEMLLALPEEIAAGQRMAPSLGVQATLRDAEADERALVAAVEAALAKPTPS